MSDAAEKAKQARAALTESAPSVVATLDQIRAAFGARIVALQVGDITIGNFGPFDAAFAQAPLARSYKDEEVAQEYQEAKAAIYSRRATKERASGRGNQRVDRGAQVPSTAQMEV